MGYTPTIAECRAAAVALAQITRQSARVSNAENSQTVVEQIDYKLDATLTTALTNGTMIGKKLKYVSFISPLVANYTANIGDECVVLRVNSATSTTAPYDAELWIYRQFGWEKVITAGGSTSGASGGYNTYTGTSVKVIEARGIFSTNSCDNFMLYSRCQCTGTSQMAAAVRGYAQSQGNNSSVTGGDFTGQLDVANHSNGSIVGVTGMCATAGSLTITGGALFSLRLTANLASACTGLQNGGASFIALTDQHASNKVKYLIDAHSDGSSLIDTGIGTSHLECYESDGMTFTCKGGYRIYIAGGAELYIPFGTLSS